MKRRTAVRATAMATGISLGLFPFLKTGSESPEFSQRYVMEFPTPAEQQKPPEAVTKVQGAVIVASEISAPELVATEKIIDAQIIPRLGEFGLTHVEAEEGVNKPNEFMAKVNEDCGSQFNISESTNKPGLLNISPTVFGRLNILRKYTKIEGLPEFDNRLAHTEGALNEGFDFLPTDIASVNSALNYTSETTKYVCKNQGLLDKL